MTSEGSYDNTHQQQVIIVVYFRSFMVCHIVTRSGTGAELEGIVNCM